MRRREFIAGLGGAAVLPMVATAQQRPLPVIGFLNSRSEDDTIHLLAAFHRGLTEYGYVGGQTVTVEYRLPIGIQTRSCGSVARRSWHPSAAPRPNSDLTLADLGTSVQN